MRTPKGIWPAGFRSGISVGEMKRVLLGNETPAAPEGPYSLGRRTVSSAGRQMFRPASIVEG